MKGKSGGGRERDNISSKPKQGPFNIISKRPNDNRHLGGPLVSDNNLTIDLDLDKET